MTNAARASTPRTAVLIGQPQTCRQLEQQLNLLDSRPVSLGWILTSCGDGFAASIDLSNDGPVLGTIDELESILARRRAAVALISLPAVMTEAIAQIRTRLRKLGVPDRFMPTLEDQIAGIGPRTQIDVDLAALIGRPARQIDATAVRRIIEGKRVLVTGAGGSIGSELCRLVAKFNPQQLAMIERSENALFEIDRQIARKHPALARKAILHDVVDAAATLSEFRTLQPQVVFHSAAHKHVPMMEDHPAAAIDNNLFGTVSVADAADDVGCERFVMISTDKAVNPTSVMGATKRLAEIYVQGLNHRSRTGYAIVRFGNVLGSSGSVLDTWARQIADGGPITVTDPRMTRYFMTIPEAAALVAQAAALVEPESKEGDVYLLDMGEPFKIVDLACRFIQQHGLTPSVQGGVGEPSTLAAFVQGGLATTSGSIPIVFTGIRPGEKLYEELVFDAQCMRPTRHPDIAIWALPEPDAREIEYIVRKLDPNTRNRDPKSLADDIHSLVPENKRRVAA